MRKTGMVLVCALFSTHCTREGCPTGYIPSGSMCVLSPDGGLASDAGVDAQATDAFVAPDANPCGTQLRCMEACVDQLSDRNHCGGCGVQCDFLQECNAGTCNQPVSLLQGASSDAIVAIDARAEGALRCVAGNMGPSTWMHEGRTTAFADDTAFVDCLQPDGTPAFAIQARLANTPRVGDEGIRDIAVSSTRTYFVGALRGTVRINGTVSPNTATGLDGIVASASNNTGAIDAVRTLHGSGDASVEAIDLFEVAGGSTTVCYGGWFTPDTQFESPISTPPYIAGRDAFVSCKVDDGTALNWWFGAAGDDAVTGVAVVDGYVYVVGHLSGPVTSGVASAYLGSNAGGDDAFLLRLSLTTQMPDFGIVWGSPGDDRATDVVADAAHIAVTGHCAGPIAGLLPSCAADQDGFLIVLDPSTTLSAQLLQSPFADSYESVALGSDILATGYIGGAAMVGSRALLHAGANGTRDAVVARYMRDGTLVDALSWGSTGDETGHAVAVSASGVVRVGGAFDSSANVAGNPLMSMGETDGFLVRR